MGRHRKTAIPVIERGIFTDELPPPKKINFQSEEEFFKQTAQELVALRSGSRTEPVVTVSFESASALLSVLTPKRALLIETVKEQGRFESIDALAKALDRDRGTVSKDLKALAEAGLLRVQEAVLSGHGRRAEITPVAPKLKVELTL